MRPLFFKECEWEIAQVVDVNASTLPKHLHHNAYDKRGSPYNEHWIGKNPDNAGFPYVIVNEYVCASLASALGLKVPDCKITYIANQAWFVSFYLDSYPFTPSRFTQSKNLNEVPLILLFDIWVCNLDRSSANLLLVHIEDTSSKFEIIVIDHSHALLNRSAIFDGFSCIPPEACLSLPFLNRYIKKKEDFTDALLKLWQLDDNVIDQIITDVPDSACQGLDKTRLINELISRKKMMPHLIDNARSAGCFPLWT
jgi:hypothetical protein